MGDVGNFLLGGSKTKQNSSGSSDSTSQNTSVNGSVSDSSSNNAAASHANGYNLSYGPVAAAMTPTLGMTAAGGNMLGALLGVPGYSATGGPAPANPAPYAYTPPAAPGIPRTPPSRHGGMPSSSDSGLGSLAALIGQLGKLPSMTPATPPTPPAYSGPTPGQIAAMQHDGIPGNAAAAIAAQSSGAADRANGGQYRALGGPVDANKPYVVGEHQPEVFVPSQPGTIVPSIAQHQDLSSRLFGGGGFGGGNSGGFAGMIRAQPPRVGKGAGGIATPGPVPAPATPPVPPMSTVPGTMPPAPTTPATPATPVDPDPQGTALNNYFNSSGGQFLMGQGQNAINSDASARGVFQSGATGQALQKMGTGLASTYMNDYIGHLLDFSKLGLGGAGAMSGAGGVNSSGSTSSGSSHSTGASIGQSAGSSTGTSSQNGSSSGSEKKGLIPDLTAAASAAASGGMK